MHNIEHRDFIATSDKKKIEESINSYVEHATYYEGGHGLYNPIRWIDKTFDTYDEAYKYIDEIDRGDYDQLAVKFKSYPQPDASKLKKYEELNKKVCEAKKASDDFEMHNHFKDVKAAFIGCPNCKSKINREIYTTKWCDVKTNYCPVCRQDMRSETLKKKSEAMKAKVEKLRKQAEDEMTKQQMKLKPEVRWLVKFEYHT